VNVLAVLAASVVFVGTTTSVSADRELAVESYQAEVEPTDDVPSIPVEPVPAPSVPVKSTVARAPAPSLASNAVPEPTSIPMAHAGVVDQRTQGAAMAKHVRIASGARARVKSSSRPMPPSDNPF
jgi:hypothetical protein